MGVAQSTDVSGRMVLITSVDSGYVSGLDDFYTLALRPSSSIYLAQHVQVLEYSFILLLQGKGVLGRVNAEFSCGAIEQSQKTGL